MPDAKRHEPPELSHRYACIVDRDAIPLAALISSYLFVPGTYLPLFLLRRVHVTQTHEEIGFLSEAYVAELMAGQDSVFIGNALGRMGAPQYLILAGLNEAQKSYLLFPKGSTVIEISDVSEVESKLLPLTEIREELRCKPEDILSGLVVAQRRLKRLVLDEDAPPLPEIVQLQNAAVVVELIDDAAVVVAINYGNAINASVLLVDSLVEDEPRQVQNWIQDWKENDNPEPYQQIKEEVERRIGSISFGQFEYATFFTGGLPYSLILEDIIPCTYVHLSLKPDLFILNSILFRDGERFGSAVVFSPTFFTDEETSWLSEFFVRNRYYLRPLIAENASLATFDFHAQYFPYDLLHICSHGGEVDGYEMSEQFTDRDGKTHTVEFEEVIGVTPAPDKPGMVAVHRKVFPRKLDGLGWMSPELKKYGLPSHVSLDMWRCLLESKGVRSPKGRVAMSCAIACADTIHQGQFHALASYSSPIVFNNTCWSWFEVAAFFLACGARGYIGTLWAIDNDAAVHAARTFYENLFSGSVLSAFCKAAKAIDETSSKGIYVYWGLHFTSLPPAQSPRRALNAVRKELMLAVESWVRKIESTKTPEVRANSIRVLRLLVRELLTHFLSGESIELEKNVKNRVPDFERREIPDDSEEPSAPAVRRSIECPVEFRHVGGPAEHDTSRTRAAFPPKEARLDD
jgi:hypothetical protein